MTDHTPLDIAHAAMEMAAEDDAARLRFFERLADADLSLLLEDEAKGSSISPQTFDVADGHFVVAFDREDRLAQFAGAPAPYAAMSGRALVEMLTGRGFGIALNPDVAPSSILIPAEAVDWLAQTLDNEPQEAEARIAALRPPKGLPEALLTGLDAKLASAAGLARLAYLAAVEYDTGRHSHLLALIDPVPGAEQALAQAAAEALTFSGIEAGEMDVAFFAASDPVAAVLAQKGLRFDLPVPAQDNGPSAGPGLDPDKPPILR